MDANFHLRLKDQHVKRDYVFGPGWVYLVENKAYLTELTNHHDNVVVHSLLICPF